MVGVAALLDEARRAGLRLAPDGDRLVIRGPKAAERLARALLEHKREVLSLLPRYPSASEARREPRAEPQPAASRVYFRTLDSEVWLTADDDAERLEAQLRAEGDGRPVIRASELCRFAELVAADARAAVRAALAVMREFPGSRLRHPGPEATFDA
jgi:hypothetical protein